MNKKIMLFSRDPGGANTIAPLYKKLMNKGYDVILYGKDAALNKYNQYGLYGMDINTKLSCISQDQVNKFLFQESPGFLITGTSADDFTEKYFWKAAEKLNIKSFAILDQWVNYGVRFSNYSVNELEKYNKNKIQPYLPYKILVMDEYAKKQIINEGISKEKIFVSGQPYFDYLIEKQRNLDKNKIFKLKKDLCKNKDKLIITYVSEPISKTYNENDSSQHYWGYNERTIFKQFFYALNKISDDYKINIKLIIRLHPKEDENNYNDIIDNIHSKYISISTDKKIDGFNLMFASDLICGMSSMFLIEAAIIGKPIISMQMGLKRENSFILDKKGILKSVLSEEYLQKKLKNILVEHKIEDNSFKIEKGAVDKVIEYMEVLICQF
ncbi:UDP-N-acetylglucosamine 2-epimerase [Clostridium tyrobutyricum]|uniref:UDP-N-acetylglucosamine 2-epimerase n=1 Tax=Clostridium tyrobutyricum TaxID=1519 RepID=UPI0018AB4E9B|nr:UDP-N-acetylglucosamine 2-epimerase [Clostridium tyrobutyricum]